MNDEVVCVLQVTSEQKKEARMSVLSKIGLDGAEIGIVVSYDPDLEVGTVVIVRQDGYKTSKELTFRLRDYHPFWIPDMDVEWWHKQQFPKRLPKVGDWLILIPSPNEVFVECWNFEDNFNNLQQKLKKLYRVTAIRCDGKEEIICYSVTQQELSKLAIDREGPLHFYVWDCGGIINEGSRGFFLVPKGWIKCNDPRKSKD